MKICDTCGKALPDQTKFCPNCGTPIHDPPPFVSQQDTLGSIIQFEPPHQSAPSPEQKQTYYGQPHPGYPPIAPAYVPQQTQSNGKKRRKPNSWSTLLNYACNWSSVCDHWTMLSNLCTQRIQSTTALCLCWKRSRSCESWNGLFYHRDLSFHSVRHLLFRMFRRDICISLMH